jgi:hypothetical protein
LSPTSERQRRVKDAKCELSINWEDDGDVVGFTLRQPNSQHGAAHLLRSHLDGISGQSPGSLSYERQPMEGNRHHGNILFNSEDSNPLRKMLAAALALHSRYVPPRP